MIIDFRKDKDKKLAFFFFPFQKNDGMLKSHKNYKDNHKIR